MASTVTTVRIEKDREKQASKPRRVKPRAKKVDEPFDEVAALESFKKLMLKHGGKHKFEGFVD